jgi:hypothetical protein
MSPRRNHYSYGCTPVGSRHPFTKNEGCRIIAQREIKPFSVAHMELLIMRNHNYRITESQLKLFRQIKDNFRIPALPSPNSWRGSSNDEIWTRVMSQVVVAGKSSPAKKLWNQSIQTRIAWNKVSTLSEANARRHIWSVLNDIGARFRGKTSDSCKKTTALLHNLSYLRGFSDDGGGPKEFLKHVATLKGTDLDKARFIMDHMSFIKSKGARDFLISGFGLTRNCIALDSRFQSVLERIGIVSENEFKTIVRSETRYEEFESFLINHVCRPLELNGAQFDQLIYKNMEDEKILKFLECIGK